MFLMWEERSWILGKLYMYTNVSLIAQLTHAIEIVLGTYSSKAAGRISLLGQGTIFFRCKHLVNFFGAEM